MQEFWFYIELGFNHVMDLAAYDHILFLCALAIPFTFKQWKRVVLLATVFTVAHCLSLALSVYDVLNANVKIIEFLIPVTILFTAILNIFFAKTTWAFLSLYSHILATGFFGIIHGFGFSNYFNMLMAEQETKLNPLLGFAAGIEISQLCIISVVLLITSSLPKLLGIKQLQFVMLASIIVALITIPMLTNTFPW
ncbi:MAG: HupE/UreJ family protein [Flavobacteriaceae bacterium]